MARRTPTLLAVLVLALVLVLTGCVSAQPGVDLLDPWPSTQQEPVITDRTVQVIVSTASDGGTETTVVARRLPDDTWVLCVVYESYWGYRGGISCDFETRLEEPPTG